METDLVEENDYLIGSNYQSKIAEKLNLNSDRIMSNEKAQR